EQFLWGRPVIRSEGRDGNKITRLVRAFSHQNCPWGSDEYFDVEPNRPGSGISQVKANHIIELYPTSALDLPQSRNPRLHGRQTLPVPQVIMFAFIDDRWTGSN